ncbi:MAG TPA: DoxX family protein [Opitutus sp.]|nr:DoxX family protein [Opitutus sp.]
MNAVVKFFQLNFLPRSTDLALLVLRLWLGLTILLNHGWSKLAGFSQMSAKFPDPLGVGPAASLGLAVFAEVVMAALLALGLFTRFAALVLLIELGVAFVRVHGHALGGPMSGELAFLYLAGFAAILIAGGGKFAVDRSTGAQ